MEPRTKGNYGLRWVMLFLASLLMLGSYYSYDVPASLKDLLRQRLGMSKEAFEPYYGLLYSVYSLPNIVLPFFGGVFVDRFGARVCLLVFTFFIVAGQLILALGTAYRSVGVMMLGRVIYGLGGENLSVGQSALVAEWFKGKELALAFGINLSCSRLGSVINNLLEPVIAKEWGGVTTAVFFSVFVCLMSLVCALVMAPVDKLVTEKLKKENRGLGVGDIAQDGKKAELLNPLLDMDDEETADNSSRSGEQVAGARDRLPVRPSAPPRGRDRPWTRLFKTLGSFSPMFWLLTWCCLVTYACVLPFNNIASSLLQERNYFKAPPEGCHLQYPDQCEGPDNPPVGCPADRWYQPPLSTQTDVSKIDCSEDEFSGEGSCTYEYCRKQSDAITKADQIMSIPYIMSAVLSPVLGLAVDRFGKRAVVVALSPAVLILVHLTLAYARGFSPVLPLIGQGLCYSAFAAVLWPSIPYTVAEDRVGMAYGLTTAVQNGGLALFPLVAAAIYKESHWYLPNVEWLFVGLAMLGVVGGVLLNILDARHNHILNRVH